MLERAVKKEESPCPYIHFNNIKPDSSSVGLCFVQSGQHKMTRYSKPFIVLYLRDIDGNCIPGYIFDIEDIMKAGLDLTQIERKVVKLGYTENFLPHGRMSVLVNNIGIVTDATPEQYAKFLGSVDDINEVYNSLLTNLSELLGSRVMVPYTICTTSYREYSQGAVGGIVTYYRDLLDTLKICSRQFKKEELHNLWGTFAIYVFAHSNYIAAVHDGGADINLTSKLISNCSRIIKDLKLGSGALEVITMLEGVQPKDIFVRTISNAAKMLSSVEDEVGIYRTLPESREGGTGTVTIKRYKSFEP